MTFLEVELMAPPPGRLLLRFWVMTTKETIIFCYKFRNIFPSFWPDLANRFRFWSHLNRKDTKFTANCHMFKSSGKLRRHLPCDFLNCYQLCCKYAVCHTGWVDALNAFSSVRLDDSRLNIKTKCTETQSSVTETLTTLIHNPCPQRDSKPRSGNRAAADLRLKARGHRDRLATVVQADCFFQGDSHSGGQSERPSLIHLVTQSHSTTQTASNSASQIQHRDAQTVIQITSQTLEHPFRQSIA